MRVTTLYRQLLPAIILTLIFLAMVAPTSLAEAPADETPAAVVTKPEAPEEKTPKEETPTSLVSGLGPLCLGEGDCTVCDGLKVLLNIVKWLLGTIGGLSLFFIVYGGFDLLASGGNPEKIEGGKKKIFGAIIGLAIVLGAWTLINVILIILSPKDVTKDASGTVQLSIFKSPTAWSQIQCGPKEQ